MNKPTKQDKQEFFQFCANATVNQLENIILKETKAKRLAYSEIAFKVRFAKLAGLPLVNTPSDRFYWQPIPERISYKHVSNHWRSGRGHLWSSLHRLWRACVSAILEPCHPWGFPNGCLADILAGCGCGHCGELFHKALKSLVRLFLWQSIPERLVYRHGKLHMACYRLE